MNTEEAHRFCDLRRNPQQGLLLDVWDTKEGEPRFNISYWVWREKGKKFRVHVLSDTLEGAALKALDQENYQRGKHQMQSVSK
jgi:hypothetical protein